MKLILASNSPRRKEILKNAGYDFEIIPSNYEENIHNKVFSKDLVENCAKNKALSIKKENHIIISADTVVVVDNIILGKPKNKLDAFNMLMKLSNKTHFVATSICLIKNDNIVTSTEITYVTFKKLTNKEINDYINNYNPLDKAGSYGIQDENFNFCTNLKGNLDNVIGFPLNLFKELLNKI